MGYVGGCVYLSMHLFRCRHSVQQSSFCIFVVCVGLLYTSVIFFEVEKRPNACLLVPEALDTFILAMKITPQR